MHIHRALALPMLGALLIGSLTIGLDAQKGQAELEAQRQEKLKKPFVTHANWILDYDKARAAAKEQKKWILTYFTRSYSP